MIYRKLSDEELNKVLLERLGQEESTLSYVTDLNLAWQLGEGIYCSLYRLSDRKEQFVTISTDEQPHDESPFYSAYGAENPARLIVRAWLYYKDGEDESLID